MNIICKNGSLLIEEVSCGKRVTSWLSADVKMTKGDDYLTLVGGLGNVKTIHFSEVKNINLCGEVYTDIPSFCDAINEIINPPANNGGGDATAANQVLQIAELQSILTELQGVLTVTTEPGDTSIRSKIPATLVSTTLLASNPNRKSAVIVNDSPYTLYIGYGASAVSDADYTWPLFSNDSLEITTTTEQINGIFDGNVTGDAKVTETT